MRGRWHLVRREWRLIVGFGIIAVAGAQLCYFAAGLAHAGRDLPPDRVPRARPPRDRRLARTRRAPTARTVAGSALSIGGLVLVIDIAGATPDLLGVLFALAPPCASAATSSCPLGRRSCLPWLSRAGGLTVATIALGTALLVGVLPAAAPLVDVDLLGAVVPWWVPLGVIVLVATAFAYVTGIVAAGRWASGSRRSWDSRRSSSPC